MSKYSISVPPGDDQPVVDMKALLGDRTLEAGRLTAAVAPRNKRSARQSTGAQPATGQGQSDYASRMGNGRAPAANTVAAAQNIGNMDRTFYDGMASPSAIKNRQQAGFTVMPGPSNARSEPGAPGASHSMKSRISGLSSKLASKFSSKQPSIHDAPLPQTQNQLPDMKPQTQYNKKKAQVSDLAFSKAVQAVQSQRKSFAPKSIKPIPINPADADHFSKMASQQPNYNLMSKAQKSKQDQFVNQLFNLSSPCPDSFTWERVGDGYQCKGGKHFVDDILVQELKGGLYQTPEGLGVRDVGPDGRITDTPRNADNSRGDIRVEKRIGPYYPDSLHPNLFMYFGPNPIPYGAQVCIASGESQNMSRKDRLYCFLDFCNDNGRSFERALRDGGTISIAEEITKEIASIKARALQNNRGGQGQGSRHISHR